MVPEFTFSFYRQYNFTMGMQVQISYNNFLSYYINKVQVGNATRAVHTRAAAYITAEGRVFENVL